MALINKNTEYSLSPISFRGSREDKQIMEEFAEKLHCSSSAVVRIALRLLKESCTSAFIPELFHRVHTYNVVHSGKNVVHYESVNEALSEYLDAEVNPVIQEDETV